MHHKILVVQYEQFFNLDESNSIEEAVREGLDHLRGYAGARVIGSYETQEDDKFLNKAVTTIIVNAPVTISVD